VVLKKYYSAPASRRHPSTYIHHGQTLLADSPHKDHHHETHFDQNAVDCQPADPGPWRRIRPEHLGVIPAGGKGRVELSDAQKTLIGKPIALAVSLEPKGGSPTGQPTGPVLYQGALAAR